MCLGVVLFGSNLFGTLCASWTCMSISFAKLGKFSFIILSNKFSVSCSSSSSGITMIQKMACLEMSQSLHILSSFFLNSCFFFLFWLNVYFFLMFQIVALNLGFLFQSLHPLSVYDWCPSRCFPSPKNQSGWVCICFKSM